MTRFLNLCRAAFLCAALASAAAAGAAGDPLDPYMGDWKGDLKLDDGATTTVFAQVVALGGDQYRVKVVSDLEHRVEPLTAADGKAEDAVVNFPDLGTMTRETFVGTIDALGAFSMKPFVRRSPTLGAKPPEGAVVLLGESEDLSAWEHPHRRGEPIGWKPLEGGGMQAVPGQGSVISKRKFADMKAHIEFRTPFMPEARGQGRGNSGVYFQGRYEVQVLDSYGLEGRDNECGGIYSVAAPRVNMCFPPRQWQTYDVVFRAPRFNDAGEKTADARITVVHNGVKIHEDQAIPGPTAAALDGAIAEPGGLFLQDHGNPAAYRNIWVVELAD